MHERENVIVWTCFGGANVGDFYIIKGNLNKEGYQSIFQHYSKPIPYFICNALACNPMLHNVPKWLSSLVGGASKPLKVLRKTWHETF